MPKPLETGERKLRLVNGTLILVNVCYNVYTMRIHVPITGKQKVKKDPQVNCFCTPQFALGKITTVQSYTEEELYTERMIYTLDVCIGELYIMLENVPDANFGKYFVGQYVLVSIGEEMDAWDIPLDCSKTCLMDNPRFEVFIVSPIQVPGKMKQWEMVIY